MNTDKCKDLYLIKAFLYQCFLDKRTVEVSTLRAKFPNIPKSTAYRYLNLFNESNEPKTLRSSRYRRVHLISPEKFAHFVFTQMDKGGFKSTAHLYSLAVKINEHSRPTFNRYFRQFREQHADKLKQHKLAIYRSHKEKLRGFYTAPRGKKSPSDY